MKEVVSTYKVYADCGDIAFGVCVICETQKEA